MIHRTIGPFQAKRVTTGAHFISTRICDTKVVWLHMTPVVGAGILPTFTVPKCTIMLR